MDEGHKIKNEHSLISKAMRKVHAQYVLLLTGTPLQNNLHELYAVLNYLHPQIFDEEDPFDSCFELIGSEAKVDHGMLDKAHYLLRAFMLRRVKSEVENKMPPKLETTIDVPMSSMQVRNSRRKSRRKKSRKKKSRRGRGDE